MNVCYVNGVDIGSLGMEVTGIAPWSGVGYDRAHIPIPGAMGGIPGALATSPARDIRITGYLDPGSVAARAAALDLIRYHIGGGLLEVTMEDYPGRYLAGLLTEDSWDQLSGLEYVSTLSRVRYNITIRCHDPVWRDSIAQSVSGAATPVPVPMGTAPQAGMVYLFGAATNPVLTYRGVDGDAIGAMGFTVTLAADEDFLALDLARQRVRLWDDGVESNGQNLLTSGAWFALDPMDGYGPSESWPTLEVSGGTFLYVYERRWR
jgi:hypothetical protein